MKALNIKKTHPRKSPVIFDDLGLIRKEEMKRTKTGIPIILSTIYPKGRV
jgi:hypothetical protein